MSDATEAAHPSAEQLGAPDLKVAGLQLWVHGRQFPESQDFYDGNWLRVTAHAGAAGASVWASGAILMVPDLARWADGCDALLQGGSQDADLAPMEPELRVRIRRMDSLGHYTMHVQITPDNLTQDHSFDFEIDQTYLTGIVSQCRAIVNAYPVRGEAPQDGG